MSGPASCAQLPGGLARACPRELRSEEDREESDQIAANCAKAQHGKDESLVIYHLYYLYTGLNGIGFEDFLDSKQRP
jgi:hypothetical protein